MAHPPAIGQDARPVRRLLILNLAGADPMSPEPWAGWDALPFLGRLCGQGAWLGFAGAGPAASAPWEAVLPALAESHPGLTLGLFNLPISGPPPPAVLFAVPKPSPHMAGCVHPPELALDLGDYLPGAVWTVGRPRLRRHERDMAVAQQAAFARLAYDHASRLIRLHGPGLSAVDLSAPDLGGLELAREMYGSASSRELLLLRQLDAYASGLAEAAGAQSVACLAGGLGALLWSPGLISPGWSGEARVEILPGLIWALLGLEPPAGPRGTMPSGLFGTAAG